MQVIKIFEDLILFNSSIPNLPLTFNQYLLLGEEPMLCHTGNMEMAKKLLPELEKLLGGRSLSYIFISHFEGDECGGLSLVMEKYPRAKPVCSQVTARQLYGFGLNYDLIAKMPGESLKTKDYVFEFISYPSEMHMWEGLLAVETHRGIIFSSDLFIRMGELKEAAVSSNWSDEINKIANEQIPSPAARETLQQTLLKTKVKYIAPGHGPFINL